MRPVLKVPLRNFYNDSYDILRRDLIESIGPYCSYCEAPLSVDVPVEHKIPKSDSIGNYVVNGVNFNNEPLGFPAYATQWRNLDLACESCNSAKGSRPNAHAARDFLFQTGQDWRDPTYDAMFMAAVHSCIWPDSSPQVGNVPALLGDQTFYLLTFEHAQRSQVYLATQGYRRALSNSDANKPWATNDQNMVWVIPDTVYIGQQPNSALLLKRVKFMLQNCGLNNYHVDDPRQSDRRVQNRTDALANIIEAEQFIAQAVQSAGAIYVAPNVLHAIPNTVALAVRETAIAKGFFSLWYRYFATKMQDTNDPVWSHYPPADVRALFTALFLKYPAGTKIDGVSDLVFAGTDLGRLPW